MRDRPQTETVTMTQTLAFNQLTFRPARPLFGPIRLRRPLFGRRRATAALPPIPGGEGWALTWHDARDFLMAYAACAVAVAMFMA